MLDRRQARSVGLKYYPRVRTLTSFNRSYRKVISDRTKLPFDFFKVLYIEWIPIKNTITDYGKNHTIFDFYGYLPHVPFGYLR